MRDALRRFPPDYSARRQFNHFATALGPGSKGRMAQKALDAPGGFHFGRVDDHQAVVGVAKAMAKEVRVAREERDLLGTM